MKIKIICLIFGYCFLFEIKQSLAGECKREENCTDNCPLVCKNATETEVINSLSGYNKVVVKYGSLRSAASLFLNNPKSIKILEISENADTLNIQEKARALRNEIGLEELLIEKTDLKLLHEKLFENFGQLKKITINECFINRVFLNLFQHVNNLEYLSLRSNGITEIENSSLSHLHKLKYVDLSQNLLQTLSYVNFLHATSLQEFYVSNNPLTDFNIIKFLKGKPDLWIANMHSIYCNTFRYVVMDALTKSGYKPTYLYGEQCRLNKYHKCNLIIMKDANNRNITIAEVQERDMYETYYESNINDVFMCLDDCSTQLIDYFREDDIYADQLAASILQYYMAQLHKNFDNFYLSYDYMEHTGELKQSLEKLHSVINITSLQIEGKL